MEGFKVLLVEDDPVVRRLEAEALERWGFVVAAPDDFSDVLADFVREDPQLVILDVDLPRFDGYEWCARIRAASRVPILFVSALQAPRDAVRALAGGADDWLSKPFDGELLAARARSLVRRAYSWAAQGGRVLARSGLVFDVERRIASYGGATVELGRNEARILEVLLARDGRVASRDELMDALWSQDSFVDDNTLTVNVTRLKKKLAEIGAEALVRTAKGEGYLAP